MPIFVRHGESEGNRLGVIQGTLDFGLSDLGRRQAAEARERLRAVSVERWVSSDLAWARETAEIIADNAFVGSRTGLRERGWGEGQGLTRDEIDARWGANARTGTGQIPGEETHEAFRPRVVAELE